MTQEEMQGQNLSSSAQSFVQMAKLGDEPQAGDKDRIRAALALSIAALPAAGLGLGSSAIGKTVVGNGALQGSIAAKSLVSKGLGLSKILWSAFFLSTALVAVWAAKNFSAAEVNAPSDASARNAASGIAPSLEQAPPPFEPVDPPQEVIATEVIPTPTKRAGERNDPNRATATELAPIPPEPEATAQPGERSLAEETRLLATARQGLRSNEYDRAEASIRLHQRLYPEGALVEEREKLRFDLACAQGNEQEAQAQRASFARRFPESSHLRGMGACP